MLRKKISIVLMTKVVDDLERIALGNDFAKTGLITMILENLFTKDKKLLIDMLDNMSVDMPKGFRSQIRNGYELPYDVVNKVIPDVCPSCGESKDINDNKILYISNGKLNCKCCYWESETEKW